MFSMTVEFHFGSAWREGAPTGYRKGHSFPHATSQTGVSILTLLLVVTFYSQRELLLFPQPCARVGGKMDGR